MLILVAVLLLILILSWEPAREAAAFAVGVAVCLLALFGVLVIGVYLL